MRRGVVLFITLGILMLISGIVMIFLHQGGSIKHSVRQNIALIQTNVLLKDMSGFLKQQNFSPDDLFYGSDIPVSMDLGPVSGTVTLSSADNHININTYLSATQTNQKAMQSFINWMNDQHMKDPAFMMALLQDTLDNDIYERESGSEIRLQNPSFQNGAIYDKRALDNILNIYRVRTGDNNISTVRWENTFGFNDKILDLNYASSDQLKLLFPDLSAAAIAKIAAHDTRYDKIDDIPISDTDKQILKHQEYDINTTLSTDKMLVKIDFNTTQECSGEMSFYMRTKRKTIDNIHISAIICPW